MQRNSNNQWDVIINSENKKNNNKSYKDAETRSGAKEIKTKHNLDKKEDGNKTTLD